MPGHIHHRYRLDIAGWVSARDASAGLRRLVDGDAIDRRPGLPRPEWRHLGLESGYAAAARTLLDGYPGECGEPPQATRTDWPAGLPEISVPSGNSSPGTPAFDRRWHRSVQDDDAAAAQSAFGRGDGQRLAGNSEGDLREEEHPRAGVDRGIWQNAEVKVEVYCYSGYKGDERPIRFRLEGRDYSVDELLDQWYAPHDVFFKVR